MFHCMTTLTFKEVYFFNLYELEELKLWNFLGVNVSFDTWADSSINRSVVIIWYILIAKVNSFNNYLRKISSTTFDTLRDTYLIEEKIKCFLFHDVIWRVFQAYVTMWFFSGNDVGFLWSSREINEPYVKSTWDFSYDRFV